MVLGSGWVIDSVELEMTGRMKWSGVAGGERDVRCVVGEGEVGGVVGAR